MLVLLFCLIEKISGFLDFSIIFFQERNPPYLDEFIDMSEDAFNREQLIKIEMNMLKVVGFDLGAPLSYSYLRRYSRVIHGDMKTLTLSRYLLETIQMFYEFVLISEAKLAAATFLLALKMKKMQSGIEVEGPVWCVFYLCFFLINFYLA